MSPNDNVAGLSGFRAYFSQHKSFRNWEGLYYQLDAPLQDFEREYTALRTSEGRMLPDAIVTTLPRIPQHHPLYREWAVRRRSAKSLMRYLKKFDPDRILEIGCGNGWLTNFLASHLQADCCGVDVNEIELKQGVRLFSTTDRITFVYGDITSGVFDDCKTDVIICASVIQYFPNVTSLIDKLRGMLRPGGEIHIIDTPLYRDSDAAAAKARSVEHFTKLGHPAMASYYHHHAWESLSGYRYTVLHDPNSLPGRIKRWMGHSPFPWIVVRP
jgi:SAM-dependent methyltransferase